MCACDFDMKFTFVYTGWKGTVNYSRVFLAALQRPENNFSRLPSGKIYCCLTYIFTIRTRFVATQNDVGFARK